MLKVGIVGFGFMGRMHYRCWKARPDAEIAAICDTNPNILKDAQQAVGNIEGAEVETQNLASLMDERRLFRDFDQMLARVQPDVISLTIPTYLHKEFSIKALDAGVHVLCEKPMALTVADCEQMIEAAEGSGKVLQIGHCVRFWPEYAAAKEIVRNERYGAVVAASFRRLGSTPTWSHEDWILDEKRSGGMPLDLHIHDADFSQYLFGMPSGVFSSGAKGPAGTIVHIATHYLYGDGKLVVAEGGWTTMPGFGFEMSFNIMLERATLVYDSTQKPAFRLCPVEGDVFCPLIPEGDGYTRQIDHFVRRIRGDQVYPVTTLEESLRSVRIIEAEKESIRRGERVALE